MKRRSFLKALGAGIGFVMMPELVLQAGASPVKDCASLTAAMEDMFTCKIGNESAFIEFNNAEAFSFLGPVAYDYAYKESGADKNNPNSVIRLIYQTFAYAIEGGNKQLAEEKLASYFYSRFKELDENDRKMLIWRMKPHFESHELVHFGDTWMTSEAIEDSGLSREKLLASMPDNVEYDINIGSLRYVKSKTLLHKMRMRFVMPQMTFEVANLSKPEGVPIPRLQEEA